MEHVKFTKQEIDLIRNGSTIHAAILLARSNPKLPVYLIVEAIEHEQELWETEQVNSITLTDVEVGVIHGGKKFTAMKMVRDRTRCTMWVAKGVVDAYIEANRVFDESLLTTYPG